MLAVVFLVNFISNIQLLLTKHQLVYSIRFCYRFLILVVGLSVDYPFEHLSLCFCNTLPCSQYDDLLFSEFTSIRFTRRVWARKLRNRGSITGKGETLFTSLYRPYWPWVPPIPIQWAPAAPSLEIERLGHESENSLPCIVEIKSIWSSTSTLHMPTRPTQVQFQYPVYTLYNYGLCNGGLSSFTRVVCTWVRLQGVPCPRRHLQKLHT